MSAPNSGSFEILISPSLVFPESKETSAKVNSSLVVSSSQVFQWVLGPELGSLRTSPHSTPHYLNSRACYLQVRTLRRRGVERLAQDHTATEWQSWDWNPSRLFWSLGCQAGRSSREKVCIQAVRGQADLLPRRASFLYFHSLIMYNRFILNSNYLVILCHTDPYSSVRYEWTQTVPVLCSTESPVLHTKPGACGHPTSTG